MADKKPVLGPGAKGDPERPWLREVPAEEPVLAPVAEPFTPGPEAVLAAADAAVEAGEHLA